MKIWYVKDTYYDNDDDTLIDDIDFFLNEEDAKAECAKKEAARKHSWTVTHESNRQKYEIEELARNALDEAGISWKNTSLRYTSKWRDEEYKPIYKIAFIEVAE